MVRKESVNNVRRGMTIRFSYGMDSKRFTALVLNRKFSSLSCKIECGSDRDKIKDFELFEITNCKELFTASFLQHLLSQTETSSWVDGRKSRSCNLPESRPKLR